MNALNHRESEREDWWRPRAEGVAEYISKKFNSSDVILLQEWWFDDKFNSVFDEVMGDTFERIAERRPGIEGTMRDDGMCCLVRKKGKLELVKSDKVMTGPQRIAQIIHCKEKVCSDVGEEERRSVFIGNSHLSFPGNEDPVINNQRQANEAKIILNALTKASSEWDTATYTNGNDALEVLCGDFNSNSCGLAASLVESATYNFVNCASATAEQALTSIGGQVNLGVTHCDHLGQKVSVDHIFLRLAKRKSSSIQKPTTRKSKCSALALGYLDTKGTRILSVRRSNLHIEGETLLSDHRPITAKIQWPRTAESIKEVISSDIYLSNITMPLDPLEPPWGNN